MGSFNGHGTGHVAVVPLVTHWGREMIRDIKNVIQELRKGMDQIHLSDPLKLELTKDLEVLDVQLAAPEPAPDLVRHGLVPILYILETAPANRFAASLVPKIMRFLKV